MDAVSARRGGGATFLLEQLRALERIADLHLTIITTEAMSSAVEDHCPHAKVLSWPTLPLPIRILREQAVIPKLADNYDVVYAPGNFAIARAGTPQVLVLQSPWHFGETSRMVRERCPPAMRARLAAESLAARASIRWADRVICVSETMKSYAVEDVGDLEKISVVPSAPPSLPTPRGQHRLTGQYALAVGVDLPHKDWAGLVEAFERHKDLPPLVLVGWCTPPRRRELASHSSSVRLLGPIADRSELADLYRNSTCVVAHSHLESYGFTAVEALSMGVPLAASDIPSHREFCGPAAQYYDPRDLDSLAVAVAEAIRSGPAPKVAEAPAMARTWTDNADMTAATLRSAVGDR